ncbi:MAG: hypothetical protein FWD54_04715 [Endomicrobia bacterium]|nr:hypothetical protein [Endomicrobiia bacterium]
MLLPLSVAVHNFYVAYCNKMLCNTCAPGSHSNCSTHQINSSDADLISNNYIAIDLIYRSGVRQVQGLKICDAVLIKPSASSILLVEITAPCKPNNVTFAEYLKEFAKKIKSTRYIIKYQSIRQFATRLNSSVKFEYRTVFSKIPKTIAMGQQALPLAQMLLMKAIPVRNINIKEPHNC